MDGDVGWSIFFAMKEDDPADCGDPLTVKVFA